MGVVVLWASEIPPRVRNDARGAVVLRAREIPDQVQDDGEGVGYRLSLRDSPRQVQDDGMGAVVLPASEIPDQVRNDGVGIGLGPKWVAVGLTLCSVSLLFFFGVYGGLPKLSISFYLIR